MKWSCPLIKRIASAGKLYRQRCYVTPSVHTLLSASCLEQHSKRRPQHLYLPCGRSQRDGEQPRLLTAPWKVWLLLPRARAFFSSLEVIRQLCGHTLAHTPRRLVRCRALRDYGGGHRAQRKVISLIWFLCHLFVWFDILKRKSQALIALDLTIEDEQEEEKKNWQHIRRRDDFLLRRKWTSGIGDIRWGCSFEERRHSRGATGRHTSPVLK